MENWESGRVKELQVNYSIMRKQLLTVREDLKQRTMAKNANMETRKGTNSVQEPRKWASVKISASSAFHSVLNMPLFQF